MSNFVDDLKRGRQGEILAIAAIKALGNDVVDVTDNPDYWKQDVDLLVNGHATEIKSDWNAARTGNFIAEIVKSDGTGRDGWLLQTTAINLVFVDMVNKIAYCIKTDELRNRIIKDWELHNRNQYTKTKFVTANNYHCALIKIDDYDFCKMAV